MRDEALWQRLQAFSFDFDGPPGRFPLTLAKDHRWSRSFTKRVIEEYRRFLYLTQVSETEATPSRHVDRAWHLHLAYEENYNDQLCREVLGRRLEHRPGLTAEDAERHAWQYEATRALYAEEFGEKPPMPVWISEAERETGQVALVMLGLVGLGLLLMQRVQDPASVVVGLGLVIAGAALRLVFFDRRGLGASLAHGVAAGFVSGDGGGGCGGGGCGGG